MTDILSLFAQNTLYLTNHQVNITLSLGSSLELLFDIHVVHFILVTIVQLIHHMLLVALTRPLLHLVDPILGLQRCQIEV